MRLLLYIGLFAFVLWLFGAFGSPPPSAVPPASFFGGLWHGLVAEFTLIGMFFGWHDSIFAYHNTGFGYAMGFVFGLRLFFFVLRLMARLRERLDDAQYASVA